MNNVYISCYEEVFKNVSQHVHVILHAGKHEFCKDIRLEAMMRE